MKEDDGCAQPAPKRGPVSLECTNSGTSLLDLSEDLLGVIYLLLPRSLSSGRTALRHSCKTLYRCKAINSRIQTFSLNGCSLDNSGDPELCLQRLMAFPAQAEIHTLAIFGNCFECWTPVDALQAMLCSEAARTRLSTVKSLRLNEVGLGEMCFALLPQLFPRLQEVSMVNCESLSLALPAEISSSVRHLHLFGWNIGPGFMRELSRSFCNIEQLRVRSEDGCAYNDYRHGLMDAVTFMKGLRNINLSVLRTMPDDCLSTLFVALKDCRPFTLFLDVDRTLWKRVQTLRQQWQALSTDDADWAVHFEYGVPGLLSYEPFTDDDELLDDEEDELLGDDELPGSD
ncbi:hypothetical protein DUNSADRAFT_10490 [Dunaliella salina]|nr:hypothetical protein DUNSADRAFT_10490 [Dunaliella salina]|eukprot:KAF5833252.1 hypothetical protein DUNSADRAFT_10490 [Dunaliella salina]